MRRLVAVAVGVLVAGFFGGCLTSPVAQSGGPGTVTIADTNAGAILTAARRAFAEAGYTSGPGNFPRTISFERPAGRLGELMFGSYNRPTTFRVQLDLNRIPETNDFRVSPRVSRVSNAGRASFEDDTKMLRIWGGQLRPIMRRIQSEAEGAGGF